MRLENGTNGKLEVFPADRFISASSEAGRIHSNVRPARADAYRVIDPPMAGAMESRAEPDCSVTISGKACIMAASSYADRADRREVNAKLVSSGVDNVVSDTRTG